MSLAAYQFRAGKNGEVRRHRVLGDFDKTSQFAGGHPFRLAGDEQTECLEPCRLGERGHGGYDFGIIHISSLPDIRRLASGDGLSIIASCAPARPISAAQARRAQDNDLVALRGPAVCAGFDVKFDWLGARIGRAIRGPAFLQALLLRCLQPVGIMPKYVSTF